MLPRMNQHLPRPPRLPTQAAEGLPRWRWTVADLDRLVKLGIIEEDDKVELIGGELVPMSPTGIEHETIGTDVAEWFRAKQILRRHACSRRDCCSCRRIARAPGHAGGGRKAAAGPMSSAPFVEGTA